METRGHRANLLLWVSSHEPDAALLRQLDATPSGRPLGLSYAAGCGTGPRLGSTKWAPARSGSVAVRLPAAAPAIAIPAKALEPGLRGARGT